jgi:hypothetical protein
MVRIYHLKHSDPYLAMTALQRLCVSKPGRVFEVSSEMRETRTPKKTPS